MKKIYIVIKDKTETEHFCEDSAKECTESISYTDKSGAKHTGPHWTPEQIETATAQMKFPEGTTKWDKYVAFNSFYADLCKVLDEPIILKAAHAFYFDDEDAPKGKVYRYMKAMSEDE